MTLSERSAPESLVDGLARSRPVLIAIWALFVLPRALLILLDVTPTSDADFYYTRAASLAQGLGYLHNSGVPTAYWPPGWPMALSLAFRAFGESVMTVGLVNLACAAVTGWLLHDLTRRLSGSEAAGRIALLLYATYPNAIEYVPLALTEVFYTLLLVAICWLLVGTPSRLAWLLAGLLLGVATLVKAQTIVVVPVILGIALLRQPGFWKQLPATIGQGAALFLLAAAVVSPWTIRNWQQLHAFIPVSSNGGITLFTGNNDSADGAFTPEDPAVAALDARGLDELAYDAEAGRLGKAWIAANPGKFLALMPKKLFRLWGPDGEAQWAYETGYADYAQHAGLFQLARYANQAMYWVLLAGFLLAGIVTLLWRWRGKQRLIDWWLLPYGIAAYPTAIALVFSGQSRFHFPAMPFVCLSCAWFLVAWLARRKAAQTTAG